MIEALQNLTKIICSWNIIINLRLDYFSRYEKKLSPEMTSQYDDQISQNQTVNHTPEREVNDRNMCGIISVMNLL